MGAADAFRCSLPIESLILIKVKVGGGGGGCVSFTSNSESNPS